MDPLALRGGTLREIYATERRTILLLMRLMTSSAIAKNAEPDMQLLWVLRGKLHVVGTKHGCWRALCGTWADIDVVQADIS